MPTARSKERALFERVDELVYLGAHVELPQGRFEVENEFAPCGVATPGQAAFAAAVRDFTDLVRTGAPDPFTPAMAVMSLTMELAAALSARRDGARVELSDPGIPRWMRNARRRYVSNSDSIRWISRPWHTTLSPNRDVHACLRARRTLAAGTLKENLI